MKRRHQNPAGLIVIAALLLISIIYLFWGRFSNTTLEITSNKSGFDVILDGESIGLTRTDTPLKVIISSDKDTHNLIISDPRDDFYPIEFTGLSFSSGTIIPIEALFPDRPPTIYLEYRGYIPSMNLNWQNRDIGFTGPDGMFRGRVKKPREDMGTLIVTDPEGNHATFRKSVDTSTREELFLSYEHQVIIEINSAYDGLQLFIDDVFIRALDKGKTVMDHLLPDRKNHVFSFRDPKRYWRPYEVSDVNLLGGQSQTIDINELRVDSDNTILVKFESPVAGLDIYQGSTKLGSITGMSAVTHRVPRSDILSRQEFKLVDPAGGHSTWKEKPSSSAREISIKYGHKATLSVKSEVEGLTVLLDGQKKLSTVKGINRISGLNPDRKTHKLEIIDPKARLKPFILNNLRLLGGKISNIDVNHTWLQGQAPPYEITLNITKCPEGMDILFNKEIVGTVSNTNNGTFKLKAPREKNFDITLNDPKNRHAPFTATYKADQDKTIDLTYDLKSTLKITDAPSGLTVKLNGRELGSTKEGETVFGNLSPGSAISTLELIDPAGKFETQNFDLNLYGGVVQAIKPRPAETPSRFVKLNVSSPIKGLEVRWCGDSLGMTGEDGSLISEVPIPADSRVDIVILDPSGRHESFRREFVMGQEKVLDIAYDKVFTLTVEPSTVDGLEVYIQTPDGKLQIVGYTSRKERKSFPIKPSNEDITVIIKDQDDRNAALLRPVDLRAGGAETIVYDKRSSIRVTTNKPSLITLRRSGSDDIFLRTQPGRALNVFIATEDNIPPGMYEITAEADRETLKEDRYLGAGYMATATFMFLDHYIRTIPEGATLGIKEGTFEEFTEIGSSPFLKSDLDVASPLVYISAKLSGYTEYTVQADLDKETLLILQKEDITAALIEGDTARERMMTLKDDAEWNEAFSVAETAYKKAIELDKNYAVSSIKLAQLHFERMRKINKGPVFKASLNECEKLLSTRPEEFDPFKPSYTLLFFYYRGNIAYYRAMLLNIEKRKNLMEAVEYYQQARNLWATYAARADGNVDRFAREEIIHNLATALENTSQNREAVRVWRSMVFENTDFQDDRQAAIKRLTQP